jgi:hypothetical protein
MEAKGRWLGVIWNLKLIGAALIVTPILLAGSAWLGYSKGRQSGMLQIQTQWDAERAVQLAAKAEAEMKARQTEQALQATINRIRKEKTNEANRLAAQYAADLERVSDRPEARATDNGVPEGAVAGVGCTGAGLSRSDSEFLIWLGNEAARTQNALTACITAYDEVRREINGE